MIDMVMAIAVPLARTYGMNKAIDIAYERLGIEKPSSGLFNILTGGGIKGSFSPSNFFKRQAVNLGVKGLFQAAPKALGPLAIGLGIAGLANQFNPLNPNARNYNPTLARQIDYAKGRNLITTNPSSGLLQYGPNSVLAGQNVASMFGTNDYIGQLENKVDYFEDRIAKGKNISEKNYAKTLDELREAKGFTPEKNKTKDYGPHGGSKGGNKGGNKSGGFSSADRGAALHGAKGGLARYYRGGIASL